MNWLSLTLLATLKISIVCCNFWCVSGSLLYFHQAPRVEKESGAEGEEDIGDYQEPLLTIP